MSRTLAVTAAVCMVLTGGGVHSILAESSRVQTADIGFPDVITIDSAAPLNSVGLPESSQGVFYWADGSYVPSGSGESCKVIFEPYDCSAYEGADGFDPDTGTIASYVEVVILDAGEAWDEETEEENAEDSAEPSGGEAGEEDRTEPEDSAGDTVPVESVTPEPTGMPQISEDTEEGKTPEAGEAESGIPEREEEEEGTPEENKAEEEEAPGETEAPEEEVTPEGSEAPETEATPEVTEVPQVSGAPEVSEVPEEEKTPDIFDIPKEALEKDDRPVQAETGLSEEEKAAAAAMNHSCQGITVTGGSLPWYVQFQVSGGDAYTFSNEEDASIFQSYEFRLWDTLHQTEYKIPDGEYVTVTVPVKAGYEYVIEHLLDNGAVETIIPYVEGNLVIFQTHSFSPFGIAGSKPLVGGDIAEDGYEEPEENSGNTGSASGTGSGSSQAAVTGTPAENSGTTGNTGSGGTVTDSGNRQNSQNAGQQAQNSQAVGQQSVKTGDNTPLIPLLVILAIALVLIVAVVIWKKKK